MRAFLTPLTTVEFIRRPETVDVSVAQQVRAHAVEGRVVRVASVRCVGAATR